MAYLQNVNFIFVVEQARLCPSFVLLSYSYSNWRSLNTCSDFCFGYFKVSIIFYEHTFKVLCRWDYVLLSFSFQTLILIEDPWTLMPRFLFSTFLNYTFYFMSISLNCWFNFYDTTGEIMSFFRSTLILLRSFQLFQQLFLNVSLHGIFLFSFLFRVRFLHSTRKVLSAFPSFFYIPTLISCLYVYTFYFVYVKKKFHQMIKQEKLIY